MKLPSWMLPALLCITCILFVATAWLWKKNQSYGHQNRMLILQNDSLHSVNIHLEKEAERRKQWGATAQSKKGTERREWRAGGAGHKP